MKTQPNKKILLKANQIADKNRNFNNPILSKDSHQYEKIDLLNYLDSKNNKFNPENSEICSEFDIINYSNLSRTYKNNPKDSSNNQLLSKEPIYEMIKNFDNENISRNQIPTDISRQCNTISKTKKKLLNLFPRQKKIIHKKSKIKNKISLDSISKINKIKKNIHINTNFLNNNKNSTNMINNEDYGISEKFLTTSTNNNLNYSCSPNNADTKTSHRFLTRSNLKKTNITTSRSKNKKPNNVQRLITNANKLKTIYNKTKENLKNLKIYHKHLEVIKSTQKSIAILREQLKDNSRSNQSSNEKSVKFNLNQNEKILSSNKVSFMSDLMNSNKKKKQQSDSFLKTKLQEYFYMKKKDTLTNSKNNTIKNNNTITDKRSLSINCNKTCFNFHKNQNLSKLNTLNNTKNNNKKDKKIYSTLLTRFNNSSKNKNFVYSKRSNKKKSDLINTSTNAKEINDINNLNNLNNINSNKKKIGISEKISPIKKNRINISKNNEIIKKKYIYPKHIFTDSNIKKTVHKRASKKQMIISNLSYNTNDICKNLYSDEERIFKYFATKKDSINKDKRNNSFDNYISKINQDENSQIKRQKNFNKIIFDYNIFSKPGEIYFGEEKLNQDTYFDYDLIENYKIFGVCDGHGEYGHLASEYVKNNLPLIINEKLSNLITYQKIKTNITENIPNNLQHQKSKSSNNLPKIQNSQINQTSLITPFSFSQIKNLLIKSFIKINSALINNSENKFEYSGTTCVSLIFNQKNINKIYISNLGDSRALIIKQKNNFFTCKQLSRDHKPTEKDESSRIFKNGGHIEKLENEQGNWTGPLRVWDNEGEGPGLAMTRSFGDEVGKKIGVICEPEITEYEILKEDKVIIIASDGLWEHMMNKEITDIVKKNVKKSALIICDELYNAAYERWKMKDHGIDDVTIIVILLKNEKINGGV